jgi:hypothetical protein
VPPAVAKSAPKRCHCPCPCPTRSPGGPPGCRIKAVLLDQGGSYGAAGPASRAGLPLGRPARRTPGHGCKGTLIKVAHPSRRQAPRSCQPRSPLSSSRPHLFTESPSRFCMDSPAGEPGRCGYAVLASKIQGSNPASWPNARQPGWHTGAGAAPPGPIPLLQLLSTSARLKGEGLCR